MKRFFTLCSFTALIFTLTSVAKAQSVVVPAGTLLRCTMDEPNFSSKTASIGDPFVCHLSSVSEFGHIVFPRGSYLGGHLAADKDPGHFWGKGYLKLEFDRIGVKNSELPVPSKVIAAQGFKVDRKGDILGKGHATRDTIEWLFPPLWPWKVLTLPARGPRPALKGEEQITLRLMDDIEVPRSIATIFPTVRPSVDRIPTPDRPPWAYGTSDASALPQSSSAYAASVASGDRPSFSSVRYMPPATPALESDRAIVRTNMNTRVSQPVEGAPITSATIASAMDEAPSHITLLALKSGAVSGVSTYRIDNGQVNYVATDGSEGSVKVSDIDWRRTSLLNSGHGLTTAIPQAY